MAWLELEPSGRYHVAFRFGDRKFKKSLSTKNKRQAETRLARLEETIRLVESGRLEMPAEAEVATFLLSDGKLNGKPRIKRSLTLAALVHDYAESQPEDAVESATTYTANIHINHLLRILGRRFDPQTLSLGHLQRYVDRRSKEKSRKGTAISPTTIKMELATFSAVWKWARRMTHVKADFPNDGLKYPKEIEKPPFQTWEEIERRIARGGLTEREKAELWDCLFLTLPEIDELLRYVKTVARHAFIYPMVVFAAHTGARRSEMMRSEIDDIGFDGQTVVIREKKRVRGKLSTRRVPLSPLLVEVMRDWLENHPGGKYTFCLELKVARGGKTRELGTPLTRDEARDHFKRTLAGSMWEKIRGWHIFRHSFCSNCAAMGIDQRIINAWVGHQTEEMVRRYRHLIPNQQQEAIQRVFGTG